jgi:uncharacterized membrane protein YbhN (UPF0104 family)
MRVAVRIDFSSMNNASSSIRRIFYENSLFLCFFKRSLLVCQYYYRVKLLVVETRLQSLRTINPTQLFVLDKPLELAGLCKLPVPWGL